MKRNLKKRAVKATVVSSALLIGLAAGSALAYNTDHENIILKDHDGSLIVPVDGKAPAYSVKTTCFGTTGCHGTGTGGTLALTYDEIERHSYHAMNGSNELRGFNSWNPDGVLPDGTSVDPFQRGVGTQNKNWVQGPAHVGSW